MNSGNVDILNAYASDERVNHCEKRAMNGGSDTQHIITGELISFNNPANTVITVKRPNSTICLSNGNSILSSSSSSYFSNSGNELKPKPRPKASSLTLDTSSYSRIQNAFHGDDSRHSSTLTTPRITSNAYSSPGFGDLLSADTQPKPPRPPAPVIHISENPLGLTDNTYNSNSNWSLNQKVNNVNAYGGYNNVAASPGDEKIPKTQSFSEMQRCNRLFSLGPSLHIQLPHPSSVGIFDWQRRTNLEKKLIYTLLILIALFAVVALALHFTHKSKPNNEICLTIDCVKTASQLLNAMDLTADPCKDFFQYACGNWNKKHLIPEDRSSVSTFEVLADELQILLKEILEEPNTNEDSSATLKARTLYKSCMKLEKIEEVGHQPLLRIIDSLGGWPVVNKSWQPPINNVEILLGRLRGDYNQGFIVEQWVNADDRNSTTNILQIDQASLGLPSREYYLKPNSKKDRDAYLKYMIEIAVLLGADRQYAETEMEDVLQFETKLANASMPEADRHDTGAIYNKMSIRELQAEVPEFNFLMYLNTYLPIEVTDSELIVVYAIDYLKSIGKLLRQTERKIIHNYAMWRMVNYFIPYMNSQFSVARANYRKVLYGVSAERIRWNQCVELVNKRLGMAVGALFIQQHFDPKSKEIALEMIHNIRDAFNELLDENEWMDSDTKRVAKEKANSMNERIGYPDILTNSMDVSKEYHLLQVYEDQFLFSILNLLKFEATKNLQKLREPVNKDRWTTEPAVVNAFYNPNKNDIVFPAGILQPLFYSQLFPKSLNYGGIGVVIGHEITHGFDDKGRQFDKDGNLKQWWNNETIERFRERAQCMIDQYSNYVLEDVGLNINGKMTQGENIADNGGLKQAYRAFKKWESKYGVEPRLPGLQLNHNQLFFLNYAQIWCGSMRSQDAINKIRASVHSPGPIRVIGPLSNSYDFSRAFNCPVGSRMNPLKKCSVW